MDMVQPSDQGEEDAANATAQKSTMKESTMKAIVYHKYGSPDVLALEEVGVLPREGRFRAAMNNATQGRPAPRSGLGTGSDQHADLD